MILTVLSMVIAQLILPFETRVYALQLVVEVAEKNGMEVWVSNFWLAEPVKEHDQNRVGAWGGRRVGVGQVADVFFRHARSMRPSQHGVLSSQLFRQIYRQYLLDSVYVCI